MANYELTFNSDTQIWSRTSAGIINYETSIEHGPNGDDTTHTGAAGGPYTVVPTTVPFDPIHQTGGAFWVLKEGPNTGFLVSFHTNELGYGDITVVSDAPEDPAIGTPHINPLADWRILIKDMDGGGGGSFGVTFNADTQLWTRTTTGIINYDVSLAHGPDGDDTTHTGEPGGPYRAIPTVVPFDPEHETGGSFYVLKEGPNVGYLVSFHSNSLGYGDITVTEEAGNRGPGATLATLYHGAHPLGNPHLAGASKHYNAPGEMHFTLLVDDPNINVPKPKETHYAIEFLDTDTDEWVECFQGLVWDMEAVETTVIFYGIDYLALLRTLWDERFDPTNPDKPPPNGSKYVGKTIQFIVQDQLQYAIDQLNSPVGFIEMGEIATMSYTVDIYSTFANVFDFVVGLIDSHRAGTGKFTELRVDKIGDGQYEFVVEDDPGHERPGLALEYGVLAQGYKVTPFGVDWADRVNAIGRDRTGSKLLFVTQQSGAMEARYGRIGAPPLFQDSIDENDLKRRALQFALDSSRIGRQIGVGTKLGSYRPFEGYVLTDYVPVIIEHGAVHTSEYDNDEFGAEDDDEASEGTTGTWAIIGIQWESYDDGHWETIPILWPRGRGAVPAGSGVVSAAFAKQSVGVSFSGIPILPHETTPGNVLLIYGTVGGNFSTPSDVRFLNNPPTSGSPPVPPYPDHDGWTVFASILYTGAGMNLGGVADTLIYAAWRYVQPGEITTAPVAVSGDVGSMNTTGYLFELPTTEPPELVETFPAANHTNPYQWQFTDQEGNLVGFFSFAQVDYGAGPDAVTPDDGVTELVSADSNNNPTAGGSAWPPYNWIGQKLDGGVLGVTFQAIGAYTSVNAAGILIRLADETMELPLIPYPANQGEIDYEAPGFETEPSGPGVPAHAEGYGPPDENTNAYATYKDLASGQTYTYNQETEEWELDEGSGDLESGVYDFTFASDDEWVVNHVLNGYPRVTIRNEDDEVIQAFVTYNSPSQITITFSEPVAGSVHLG